ncbi:MAG: DUF692 domain-containing protein [Gammaproteobacteria bacterium]|nr:DUF692 domain-containing protein [Gammaproteobacteria bacterium]
MPAQAGVGLRAPHCRQVIEERPKVAWFEVHSENYFGDGGPHLHTLERIRADYPLSFHGVGLSLGSSDPLNEDHLQRLTSLVQRYEPALVSEHLSWGSAGGRYLNDLLPLPHTEEAINHVAARIRQVQDVLGREILIENISGYLVYADSELPEWTFLTETARRAGCGILLDVNNAYVNAVNHGFDAAAYIDAVPVERVREIHLAGYTINRIDGHELLIDTHSRPVTPPVWDLYRRAIARFGPVPTLIEWDADLPPLRALLNEAHTANLILEAHRAAPA